MYIHVSYENQSEIPLQGNDIILLLILIHTIILATITKVVSHKK